MKKKRLFALVLKVELELILYLIQLSIRIPPPEDKSHKPLRAMVFDSIHDNYKGAIPYIRVFDGVYKKQVNTAKFFTHNTQYDITEVGHFILKQVPTKELRSGDVGYFLGNIRDCLSYFTWRHNNNKARFCIKSTSRF